MIEINSVLDAEKFLDGLKAIIFDLDDTLYPEKSYVKSGYTAVSKLFQDVPNMADQLWESFCRGGKAIDEVLGKYHTDTPENKEKALHAYRWQEPQIELYSGVRELLYRLKERKLLLGLITDGRPEGQWAKIRVLRLGALFDEIIVTDELGGIAFRKPCPKAFELMRGKMDVPYQQIAYVGDNIKKDFVSPEALGMRCIWVNNPDGLYYTKK